MICAAHAALRPGHTGMLTQEAPTVAVKTKDVDRYMANPDPGKPIILVYGPDAGLCAGTRRHAHPHIRG